MKRSEGDKAYLREEWTSHRVVIATLPPCIKLTSWKMSPPIEHAGGRLYNENKLPWIVSENG